MNGYRLGAGIFLFLFNDWTLPFRSVSTDLLGSVLEKTTCKRFIPPTQDSGVTLSIIGVYFTLVKTCACKPLYFALKCPYLFLLSNQTVATFFPSKWAFENCSSSFFLFFLHFIVTFGLLKFDSVISVTSGINLLRPRTGRLFACGNVFAMFVNKTSVNEKKIKVIQGYSNETTKVKGFWTFYRLGQVFCVCLFSSRLYSESQRFRCVPVCSGVFQCFRF